MMQLLWTELSQARTGKEMQMVKKFSTTELQFLKGLAVISPYTVYFSCPSVTLLSKKTLDKRICLQKSVSTTTSTLLNSVLRSLDGNAVSLPVILVHLGEQFSSRCQKG
jgi:hypothetical protein